MASVSVHVRIPSCTLSESIGGGPDNRTSTDIGTPVYTGVSLYGFFVWRDPQNLYTLYGQAWLCGLLKNSGTTKRSEKSRYTDSDNEYNEIDLV